MAYSEVQPFGLKDGVAIRLTLPDLRRYICHRRTGAKHTGCKLVLRASYVPVLMTDTRMKRCDSLEPLAGKVKLPSISAELGFRLAIKKGFRERERARCYGALL